MPREGVELGGDDGGAVGREAGEETMSTPWQSMQMQSLSDSRQRQRAEDRGWLHRSSSRATKSDDGVALGTGQVAEQGVDDGVAVDVERTVSLNNILARCCGASAGTVTSHHLTPLSQGC